MFFKKKITNFRIIEKIDIKGQNYFIIFDNDNQDNNNAYFCWETSVKTSWGDLVKERENWKEIEIEYEDKEKGNKVVNIWSDTSETEFLI